MYWEGAQIRAIRYFSIFVPWKWLYVVNFSSLKTSRDKTNDQNVIRLLLLMQLYAYNETRYQFWGKSKFQFLRKAENEEEMGPNFKLCFGFIILTGTVWITLLTLETFPYCRAFYKTHVGGLRRGSKFKNGHKQGRWKKNSFSEHTLI